MNKILGVNMDKKMLLIIGCAVIISGLLGFYGGRYYEQTRLRSRFKSMPGTMRQDGSGISSGGGTRLDHIPGQGSGF
ncbi:MAG: hypothetical protein ACD_25C00267G0002 [uncultured bacterium]|uniref:Uncharacterized protein n=3 Tax=Katanobacteria TaxID=422282 RepID=A0A1F4W3H2_UNCKA|nr:MAG: hypothetical protein ACD_25C00267G0002 [uncultured bacterium]KKS03602.1 MAG: hypothetical protein UU55_C0001G0063 [candidate division WWE3 bacterium GW2011_GWC2_41_23]KKS10653.1 MAG: hypothetical protein UU64_C0002G0055 [candidate division WWE3 bacterium GW2011_GWF2_41_45]KKS12336.1 MAG: hypothetical protein UU68_C0002G0062 [candidate division WWE3 bacterium GW2011_GWF1_41_53]KKS20410.1 MAG: hypothetical protein UU79_C0001G0064 [candidate division WWE3 bacterium GW2011_GWE1_41_72]KKS28